MLDLSKDRKCIEIDDKIHFYASQVLQRQVECAKRIKAGENPNKVKNQYTYPYGDDVEHIFLEELDSYVSSHKDEDNKKQIAGHFLWQTKNYLGHPFERPAARIVDNLVALYPLYNDDKIQYLEYITTAKKFGSYAEGTLYKLASFKFSGDEDATERLFLRLYSFLKNKKKGYDSDAKLIYGMMNSFVNNNSDFNQEQLGHLAKFYFRLADKSSTVLEPKFLEKALFREEGGMHYSTLKKVAVLYALHLKDAREVNEPLHNQMSKLLSSVVYWENYSLGRKEDLKAVFSDIKGNKSVYAKSLQAALDYAFQESLKVRPSRTNILAKARHLFMEEGNRESAHKGVDELYESVRYNARLKGLNVEHPTIFDENAYEIEAVDKKLVQDVADVYVQAYQSGKIGKEMEKYATDMFLKLVCRNDYTDKDVVELQEHIARDSNTDEVLIKLSKDIKKAYDHGQCAKSDHDYLLPMKRILFKGKRKEV